MPLKMLVWNIQNFTYNKINVSGGIALPYYNAALQQVNSAPRALLRGQYITDNLRTYDPDIFVVIEVISSKGTKGSLLPVTSSGGQGVYALYILMQNMFPDKNWRLVPPVKLTSKVVVEESENVHNRSYVSLVNEGQYTEAIAVFYRADKLEFRGPWVWPVSSLMGNDNPHKTAVRPAPGVTTEAYPYPWSNVLPPGNTYAGQFEYFYPGTKNEIFFPGAESRRPFTTRFVETATDRIITLVSVHYPPNSDSAVKANGNVLRYYSPKHYNADPNEAIIIAGDFNINTLAHFAPSVDDSGVFGFTTCFDTIRQMPSMYKPYASATPYSYISRQGLDNFAWRCGSNNVVPSVRGYSCERVTQPEGSGLVIPDLQTIRALPEEKAQEVFGLPQNYGKIGPVPGTSDHMAMYYEF